MLALLSWFCRAIFLVVVVYFALYVLLELRVFLISRKVEQRKLTELAHSSSGAQIDSWPLVSVLLPIYNESEVVERLIDAVCNFSYPAGLLEILVLDDSTDSTTELARLRAEQHKARGVDIRLVKRSNRKGYKAGNLVNGIQQSCGEFFAIFDADFVPPADFLLKTIPCFEDPKLGFLQTGIGYENRDVSFLTRFQAMEMGHQQYVTVGLSEDGDMASLSGSSCVWRKQCVDALGGWNASTVTEDVDLGYRAQFGEWKYAYLRDVVSMSVLPETVSSYRIQRERWGRGLIHSGFKHVKQMLSQRMPLIKRMHAISTMFSSVLLASIYVLILLSLPLTYFVHFDGAFMRWGTFAFFGLAVLWGLENAFGARRGARFDDKRSAAKDLWDTYRYIAMFLPMAWYYFVGGVRALFGVYGDFHRTPKGKNSYRVIMPRINTVLLAGEVFSFLYSAISVLLGFKRGNYFLIPLNVTVCVGFGMVLYWTCKERRSLKKY
ncbi:glycosyltransferase [Paraburkholderia tuberum]|uniref:Cellulose synthase (UDP-forming) n=1 Tax=Paraburkholderia tuberum TaxID=157910 RepID=A0A1H1IVR4_9BURK|nr:glycosyltransferase [Paraburkholderia tuberum]SDR41739.1 cellulose synthase (UDP-forming) [Paraburkholderia tuberum]